MSSTNKTANLALNQWLGSEISSRADFNEDNKKLDDWAGKINKEKAEIYISNTLPDISSRKQNTLYFKITDTVTQGTNDNLKVSPTMGVKIL